MNQPSALERIARALEDQRLTINQLDDGSGVVLDVHDEQLLTMNAVGIVILRSIEDGARTLEAIASVVSARFEVSDREALQDIREFIDNVARQLE